MSKMMAALPSKLKRKKPAWKVDNPSGREPEARESKGLVKAATGALLRCIE